MLCSGVSAGLPARDELLLGALLENSGFLVCPLGVLVSEDEPRPQDLPEGSCESGGMVHTLQGSVSAALALALVTGGSARAGAVGISCTTLSGCYPPASALASGYLPTGEVTIGGGNTVWLLQGIKLRAETSNCFPPKVSTMATQRPLLAYLTNT